MSVQCSAAPVERAAPLHSVRSRDREAFLVALSAGWLPVEFPVTSLGETNMRPTAVLFESIEHYKARIEDPELALLLPVPLEAPAALLLDALPVVPAPYWLSSSASAGTAVFEEELRP